MLCTVHMQCFHPYVPRPAQQIACHLFAFIVSITLGVYVCVCVMEMERYEFQNIYVCQAYTIWILVRRTPAALFSGMYSRLL